MKISGNELAVTARKACIGAGVVQGVAVDIGYACLALALASKPPVKPLLDALEAFSSDYQATDWEPSQSGWSIRRIEVLHSGPSVLDFARLAGSHGSVRIESCDQRDLAWGLFAATGLPFHFQDQGSGFVAGFQVDRFALPSLQPIEGLAVDDEEWVDLQNYAKATLVPADETNRADAGAGLTDND